MLKRLSTSKRKFRTPEKQVLVIGAGIAGITAALHLAREGVLVHLLEKESSPGGWSATYGCKAADICVKCSVCVVDEKIEELLKTPLIHFYPNSLLQTFNRKNSRFHAHIIPLSKSVAADFSLRKGKRTLKGAATKQHKNLPQEIEVDSVLVATGFKPYDALHKGEYGWNLYPDVITGLEAEQMLLQEGELLKPSDRQPPEKVAFIQCVGSRYAQFDTPAYIRTYCSTVCCAYALRMANLLVKRENPAEVTIFYMDLQNYGKGFNALLNSCRENIKFSRTIPSRIKENSGGKLQVAYESLEEGKVIKEDFDLVVLSIGMEPRDDASILAKMLNLREDEHGFFEPVHPDDSTITGQEGIYMAGACVSPKTIAASILEAEKAVTNIIWYLRGVV